MTNLGLVLADAAESMFDNLGNPIELANIAARRFTTGLTSVKSQAIARRKPEKYAIF